MCLALVAPAALADGNDTSAALPSWMATFNGQIRMHEFHRFHFQAQLGNRLLHTPWVWGSDSRVIPAAYQGLTASLTPIKNLSIEAAYIERWNNRTSPDFSTANLYGIDGPSVRYGGAVYGMKLGKSNLKVQGRLYRFLPSRGLQGVSHPRSPGCIQLFRAAGDVRIQPPAVPV